MGVKEDYIRGWEECASYMGEPDGESRAYYKGFAKCAQGYREKGWLRKGKDGKMIGTPPTPTSIPASLWREKK